MKTIKLSLFALVFCLSTTTSFSQIDVSINPIGALFGNFTVGADFNLSENTSVEARVGFGSGSVGTLGIDTDIDYTNFAVAGFYKYYFSPKRGCDKFYADAFVQLINRNWNYPDGSGIEDYKSTRGGLGFGLGYKIVSSGGFLFDFNMGLGRAIISNDNAADGVSVIEWTDLMYIGKFAIGYRFGGSAN